MWQQAESTSDKVPGSSTYFPHRRFFCLVFSIAWPVSSKWENNVFLQRDHFQLNHNFFFQIPRYKGNIVLGGAKRGEMVAAIPWLKSSSTSFTIITGCLWDLLIHITSVIKSGHVPLNLQVNFFCSIYTITIIQYQGHHTTTCWS